MAIMLDNNVLEAATINDAIRDQVRITGGFTEEQATDLALMLRTRLAAGVDSYLETRTVGASLGADSIQQGVLRRSPAWSW